MSSSYLRYFLISLVLISLVVFTVLQLKDISHSNDDPILPLPSLQEQTSLIRMSDHYTKTWILGQYEESFQYMSVECSDGDIKQRVKRINHLKRMKTLAESTGSFTPTDLRVLPEKTSVFLYLLVTLANSKIITREEMLGGKIAMVAFEFHGHSYRQVWINHGSIGWKCINDALGLEADNAYREFGGK